MREPKVLSFKTLFGKSAFSSSDNQIRVDLKTEA